MGNPTKDSPKRSNFRCVSNILRLCSRTTDILRCVLISEVYTNINGIMDKCPDYQGVLISEMSLLVRCPY